MNDMITKGWNRNHRKEAFIETLSAKKAVAEDKLYDAKQLNPKIFDKTESGTHKRFQYKPGARLGTFELIEVVNKDKSGGKIWLVKCDCGNITTKRGSVLSYLVRSGEEPTCKNCTLNRKNVFRNFKNDVYVEGWRRQWVDYRTLWTGQQSKKLVDNIRDDLNAEFGEPIEECPSLRFGYLETDAYVDKYESEIDTSELWEYVGPLVPQQFGDSIQYNEKEINDAIGRAKDNQYDSNKYHSNKEKEWKEHVEKLRVIEDQKYDDKIIKKIEREKDRYQKYAQELDPSLVSYLPSEIDKWVNEWNNNNGPEHLGLCCKCSTRLRCGKENPIAGYHVRCLTCMTENIIVSNDKYRIEFRT